MINVELLNYLKPFGGLGLLFIIWYLERQSAEKARREQQDYYEKRDDKLRGDLKESSKCWYELGQKMENSLLSNIGALTEIKGLLREVKDRLDVLLRRNDFR